MGPPEISKERLGMPGGSLKHPGGPDGSLGFLGRYASAVARSLGLLGGSLEVFWDRLGDFGVLILPKSSVYLREA